MTETPMLPALTHKQLLKVDKDYQNAATVANLVYVRDNEPGIVRRQRGKMFEYRYNNVRINDKSEIGRINALAIPPSWTNVWICPLGNGHIQAMGLDLRGRKQYRYHALWSLLRNETKFHRLLEFGKVLPQIRKQIETDIAGKELTQKKVLAILISLMERTYIRVGNNEYEKQNGSFGLTTLKNRHAQINGDKIVFSFKGKKGIFHDITLKNRRLAIAVKECMHIPGKELFQYYDAEGQRGAVDSGMVNHYIKEAAGSDFSAKDFRTWAGSLQALHAFKEASEDLTNTDRKKTVNNVLDIVSKKLGNTRNVCKKYYVHPGLIKLYEEDLLHNYFAELAKLPNTIDKYELSPEEQVLLKILKKLQS